MQITAFKAILARRINIQGGEDYENTFARMESDCTLRFGFKVTFRSSHHYSEIFEFIISRICFLCRISLLSDSKRIANLLIDRCTTNAQNRAPDHIINDTSHNNQHSTIWLTITFVGDLTTQLVKKLKRKLRRCLIDPNVDIRIKQKTTKLCFFTSNKDKTPRPLSRSNVVYEFTCPGCNSSYIGKTNRTLLVRTQEHALTDKESAIYKHLHSCDQIKHIQVLYSLPDVFVNENNPLSIAMNKEFLTQTVRGNTNIIDSDDNWNLLL